MITDYQTLVSNAVALTGTGTTYSDALDLASTSDVSRMSAPVRAYSYISTTFTSGGAGTLAVNLVQSANTDLTSPDILYASTTVSASIAVAALVAGLVAIDIPMPRTTKRYIGFQYVVATAAMTAGKVTSEFLLNTDSPITGRPLGATYYA